MDESRRADLKRIEKRLAAPRFTVRTVQDPQSGEIISYREYAGAAQEKFAREGALSARRAILEQAKDRKLAKLRRGLIRAAKAHDEAGELRFNARIKLHMNEEFEAYA